MALGLVLTPYGHVPGSYPAGITKSYKGATSWREPFDPQWYSRGENGYYYDTQLGAARPGWLSRLRARLNGLGALPTDFELATRRTYLPRMSGWVTTAQGYQSGGWLPPGGHYPGQPKATWLPMAGRGLGEVPIAPEGGMSAEDVVGAMVAHNDRAFALALISTFAVTTSALISIFRTLKLIKSGRAD